MGKSFLIFFLIFFLIHFFSDFFLPILLANSSWNDHIISDHSIRRFGVGNDGRRCSSRRKLSSRWARGLEAMQESDGMARSLSEWVDGWVRAGRHSLATM